MRCPNCNSGFLELETTAMVTETYMIGKSGKVMRAQTGVVYHDDETEKNKTVVRCIFCKKRYMIPNIPRREIFKKNFSDFDLAADGVPLEE